MHGVPIMIRDFCDIKDEDPQNIADRLDPLCRKSGLATSLKRVGRRLLHHYHGKSKERN